MTSKPTARGDASNLRSSNGAVLGTRRLDVAIAAILSLLALALLRLWRYPAPYPGEAVHSLLEQAGAWPRLSPQAPLWHWLAGGMARAGNPAGIHFRLQWLGHLALATTIGLLYRAILGFVLGMLDEDAAPRWSAWVVRLAACGGAVFLLVCPPVWRVAQSPHPAVLCLLLVVAASAAALRFAEVGRLGSFLVWAALAGIGVVESPVALLMLPVWLALFVMLPFGVFRSLDNGDAPPPFVPWIPGALVFGGTAGVAVLAGVLAYRDSDGFVLRGFGRTLQVVMFFARDYLSDLRGALPALGWLVVLMGLLVPWMLVMCLARRVQNGEFGFGLAFLYGVAAVAATLQVTGPATVQLWSLLSSELFRAAACLISAMTFGLVAAAWMLGAERVVRGTRTQANVQAGDGPTPPVWSVAGRLALGGVGVAIGIAMLASVAAMAQQRHETSKRAALRLMAEYSDQMVADAAGCEWVVTDGQLDPEIRLAAWKANSRLQPLCLFKGQDGWTRKAVERRLPDDESRSLYGLGPQALLRAWLADHPARMESVAVQLGSDLWVGAAVSLEPRRTLFRPAPGLADGVGTEAQRWMAEHRPFWSDLQARLSVARNCEDPLLDFKLRRIELHVGRVANELGVMLEDHAFPGYAVEAYSAARQISPDNLSCRVNLLNLLEGTAPVPVPREASLRDEVRTLARRQARQSLLGTVRLHGTIRSPRALAVLGAGASLVLSSSEATARVETALNLFPEDSPGARRLRTLLAGMQWRDGDATGGRQAYLDLLAQHPNDVAALLGMAALEAKDSGLDSALPWIDRAREAGADPLVCDQLLATLCLEAGNASAARAVLLPHVEGRLRNATVWALWGQSALALDDPDGYALAQSELGRLPHARGASALLAAQAAERSGDLRTALAHARTALNETPKSLRLMTGVLRLCINLGDYTAAQPIAEQLLVLDPGHAAARFALGTALLLQGNAKAAEPHLRRAAEAAPDVATLNNLAHARLSLGRLDEALRDAEAAVKLAPARVEPWDTLAAVALARNDAATAQEAAREAIVRAPDSPSAWLRAGEAAIALGDLSEARACLDKIVENIEQMTTEELRTRLLRLHAAVVARSAAE